MRKILIILIVILLIIIGVLSYFLIVSNNNINKYTSQEQEVFVIEQGQSKQTIIDNLYNQNLIDSKFFTRIKISTRKISFYAGEYGLSQSLSDDEVLEILNNSYSNIDTARDFLITEGSTIDTIAENLATFTTDDDSAEEILKYWSDSEVLAQIISDYDFVTDEILSAEILYPLEGYFFPATYKIADTTSIESITKLFLDTMNSKLISVDLTNSDLTTHDILTLASIVERETLSDTDKPIAAEVFYNRIELQMPLQSDITVLYAKQEHKEQVLYSDLEYESPYNTYLHKGLTPGPISTVSIESIDAVINPDSNDYIYFFADQNTGELYFSKTIEEHNEISSKYAWDFEN